ncbi:MAG TPA: hypothetical protein VNO33_10300 [Kofleriaceae bacterium]|nr:hypothetical protein [Kofleriaceae bacterium]
MRRSLRGAFLLVAAAALAAPALVACGGDEATATATDASKAPPKKKPATGRAAAGRGRAKEKGGRLDTYSQIEDRFRLPFGERDFSVDPAGDENRDPFRSFVVRQGTGPRELKGQVAIQPTDVCTEKNSRAPGNSIRDLRLIAIVLRGTRSYAQFRDPSGFGPIVRLRDCLGKEKAIVEKIGAGFVTLEVVPDAASSKEPQAERRDIQLHPAELRAEDDAPEEPAPPAPAEPAPASQP